MTQPRKVYPGQTVQLVRRTLRRTLLLRPDLDLNQLILYLVALFAQKFSTWTEPHAGTVPGGRTGASAR